MTRKKYFGLFTDRETIASNFGIGVEVMPEGRDILFASYEYEDYSGSAFVLFERKGKLYENHGSHCSCYGLEDQWQPEETSWAALAMRPDAAGYGASPEASSALASLIRSRHA